MTCFTWLEQSQCIFIMWSLNFSHWHCFRLQRDVPFLTRNAMLCLASGAASVPKVVMAIAITKIELCFIFGSFSFSLTSSWNVVLLLLPVYRAKTVISNFFPVYSSTVSVVLKEFPRNGGSNSLEFFSFLAGGAWPQFRRWRILKSLTIHEPSRLVCYCSFYCPTCLNIKMLIKAVCRGRDFVNSCPADLA